MAGVLLVGFSGSLIKDAVKEGVTDPLARVIRVVSNSVRAEPDDKPEVTQVVLGIARLILTGRRR